MARARPLDIRARNATDGPRSYCFDHAWRTKRRNIALPLQALLPGGDGGGDVDRQHESHINMRGRRRVANAGHSYDAQQPSQ
jgi:hypothetical protein